MEAQEDLLMRSLFSLTGGWGAEIILESYKKFPYELAKIVNYIVDNKRAYHRESMAKAIALFFTATPKEFTQKGKGEVICAKLRDFSWALVQKLPIYLLYEVWAQIKTIKGKNARPGSFRSAVMHKLITTNKNAIIREMIVNPSKFKYLIKGLKIPTKTFKGREIKNENLLLINNWLNKKYRPWKEIIEKPELIRKLRIPLHIVIQHFPREEDALLKLAEIASPEEFVKHIVFFEKYLGQDHPKLKKLIEEKMKVVKGAYRLERIKDHLKEQVAISEDLIRQAAAREADAIIPGNYRYIGIILDVSGSMFQSLNVGKILVDFFTKAKRKFQIVAFNNKAWDVKSNEIEMLSPGGSTSIGCGLIKISEHSPMDLIILVSDGGQNTPPEISTGMRSILDKWKKIPPFVIFWLEGERNLEALNEIASMTQAFIFDVPRKIEPVRLERLLSNSLQTVFEALVHMHEIIGEILSTEIPLRPKETKKKGFILTLIT